VVATSEEEVGALEALCRRGRENGAPGLEIVDAAAVRAREPWVRARAALWSPRTGIVDAHALCLSFAAEAEAHGAQLVLRTELVGVDPEAPGYRLSVRGPDGALSRVHCAAVVNAGGLDADAVAALAGLDVDALGYRIHPCKGDYFGLAPGAPLRFSGLVYPLHGQAGLGVHVTVDLDGRVRFGPDAHYVDEVRYDVDPAKARPFAEALRRYVPDVRTAWLQPEGAGVRPKLAGPGEAFRDFAIAEESAHGLPGFVDLVGIESPGLTAAPAIADEVVALLGA
jgi:L-2-hydroxyglutarate oxidase LhgO